MTRACYALTCLVVVLAVPSLAQSPTNSRAYCLGNSYLETCPFVDGYHDTYGEDLSTEPVKEATDESDLSGRSFVAILEDPVAESPAPGEDMATESLLHSPCPSEAFLPQAAAVETPAVTDSEPAVAGPADEYEYPYGWRAYNYSYHSYHGSDFAYQGSGSSSTSPTTPAVTEVAETEITQIDSRDYENECYEAWQKSQNEVATEADPTNEQPVNETENEPFDAYGYEYRYGCCPEEYSSATSETESTDLAGTVESPGEAVVEPMAEVISEPVMEQAMEVVAEPMAETTAEPVAEAVVEAVVEAVAEPAPWEPYGYEDGYSDPNGLYNADESSEAPSQVQVEAPSVELAPQSSYEVYDYYHGSPTPTDCEPQPVEEPAPSVPLYHGRYPYGYGYEYDYEYSHEYSNTTPAEEPATVDVTDNVEEAALDVMQWVDLGRDFLSCVGDSDLVDQVRAEAEGIMSQVASVIETLPLEQISADVTYAMTEAIQQPVATESQDDANVFLFSFESDLNAEPLLEAELPQNPWVVEAQVVTEPQPTTTDSVNTESAVESPVTDLPAIQSDQVRQWTRRAMDVAVAAWDRLAQEWDRVAARSVATLNGDESLNTQR